MKKIGQHAIESFGLYNMFLSMNRLNNHLIGIFSCYSLLHETVNLYECSSTWTGH